MNVATMRLFQLGAMVLTKTKITITAENAKEIFMTGLRESLATAKQIDYIKSLCAKTGYDPDEYNFATMTKDEASEIISEMLKEA